MGIIVYFYNLVKSVVLQYEPNSADEFAVLDKIFQY